MTPVVFTAYGMPQPAGSKKAFVRAGRALVVDDAKRSRPWKDSVAQVAGAAMDGQPLLDGPLVVSFVFRVPRPKAHFGKRGLRPSAPIYPTTRPDVLKLARAVEDALTGIVWRDDAQVVDERLLKRYGEQACVHVSVWRVES